MELLRKASLLSYVTVEITESELIACNEKELDFIENLKSMGLKISLDDFGTGYSSLRYIHKFNMSLSTPVWYNRRNYTKGLR